MSRKRTVIKKYPVKQSLHYKDDMVSKLIRMIMRHGKFSTAERVVKDTMRKLVEKIESSDDVSNVISAGGKTEVDQDLSLLHEILELIRLRKTTSSKKVGGQSFQIPKELPMEKQIPAGIKIMIKIMRNQMRAKGRSSSETLANLMYDILQKKGDVINSIQEKENLADANRIYAQYANSGRGSKNRTQIENKEEATVSVENSQA